MDACLVSRPIIESCFMVHQRTNLPTGPTHPYKKKITLLLALINTIKINYFYFTPKFLTQSSPLFNFVFFYLHPPSYPLTRSDFQSTGNSIGCYWIWWVAYKKRYRLQKNEWRVLKKTTPFMLRWDWTLRRTKNYCIGQLTNFLVTVFAFFTFINLTLSIPSVSHTLSSILPLFFINFLEVFMIIT